MLGKGQGALWTGSLWLPSISTSLLSPLLLGGLWTALSSPSWHAGPLPCFLQRLGSAGFSAPGCTVLTCSLPWGRQPLCSRMCSAAVPWELERHLLFAWEKG